MTKYRLVPDCSGVWLVYKRWLGIVWRPYLVDPFDIPLYFKTAEEAEQALDEHLAKQRQRAINGDRAPIEIER